MEIDRIAVKPGASGNMGENPELVAFLREHNVDEDGNPIVPHLNVAARYMASQIMRMRELEEQATSEKSESTVSGLRALLKAVKSSPKSASKKGEGSRGGNIIGHTSSGKPIYASRTHGQWKKHHAKFTREDHDDAANHHTARRHILGAPDGDKFGGAVESDLAYGYHDAAQDLHDKGDVKFDAKKLKKKDYSQRYFSHMHAAATKHMEGTRPDPHAHETHGFGA